MFNHIKRIALFFLLFVFVFTNTACTATPTVAPTATPTVAPTATPTVAPTVATDARFPDITIRENATMQGTVLSSEEEANRYFLKMAAEGYFRFGILVEELSMLHTADEYMEMYSELTHVEIDTITKYHNGYYLLFTDVKAPLDTVLRYAVRTGDTSLLSEDELNCYSKLYEIADTLRLQELSPIDAVVTAHDYLVLNTAYDTPAFLSGQNTPSHHASGTLLTGQAVCSGYASAFLLFMQIAGIPCEYVHSDTHAWNLVQLDNNWYHVDVTWDDPVPDSPGITSYSFFMMTDAEIESHDDHQVWECECPEHVPCTSTEYRLYPYRDAICTTTQEALDLISAQSAEDEITLIYPVAGELNEDFLLDLAMNYFAKELSYYPETVFGDSHYKLTIITP